MHPHDFMHRNCWGSQAHPNLRGYGAFLDQVFDNESLGFVGGRIELFDSSDCPITIQLRDTPLQIPPRSFIEPGLIQGANMVIRKAALEEVGGFDPDMGPGTGISGADIDLLARISSNGWHGRYEPKLLVYHHHRIKGEAGRSAKMDFYAIGVGVYYLKQICCSKMKKKYLTELLRRVKNQPIKRTILFVIGMYRYLKLKIVRKFSSTGIFLAWPRRLLKRRRT